MNCSHLKTASSCSSGYGLPCKFDAILDTCARQRLLQQRLGRINGHLTGPSTAGNPKDNSKGSIGCHPPVSEPLTTLSSWAEGEGSAFPSQTSAKAVILPSPNPSHRCHPEPKAKDLHFRLKLSHSRSSSRPPNPSHRCHPEPKAKDLHLFFASQPTPLCVVTMAACMRDRTAPTSWPAEAGHC